MLNIGIIGLGPNWETRYLPALEKLTRRIRVQAVYDPVASRAEQVAAEIGAQPTSGMLALADRSEVQAMLLLDPSWHGLHGVRMLCSRKKPVFFAGCLVADLAALETLDHLVAADSLTLVPELCRRYTPASSRLQELMATHLGRPRHIAVEASVDSVSDDNLEAVSVSQQSLLLELFDWCRYVARRPPSRISAQAFDSGNGNSASGRLITLEFKPAKGSVTAPVAEVRLQARHAGVPPVGDESRDGIHCQIECENGSANFADVNSITWHTDEQPVDEMLAAERSDVEVMLDQFCRRAIGGLIPVADLGDLCRGARLVHIADESLRTGRAVELNGQCRSIGL